MSLKLINFTLFQLGWLACVVGSAYYFPWQGTIIALLIVIFHIVKSRNPLLEFSLVFCAILIGTVWDSLLVWMQLLTYTSGMWSAVVAPYWIIALWALFATTLNVSLRWMKGRWLIAMMAGAIAGPLAYYGGYKLGAVHFIDRENALLMLAIGWAFFTPVLFLLAQRLDGYAYLSRPQRVFL